MLSKNIIYYRKKKGITQEELSNLINVSRSSIALYEKGIRNPNEEILRLLCSALDVSYEELVYNDVEMMDTKIPLKFRRLKCKDVIRCYILGRQKNYIVNALREDYLELLSLSGNDIYMSKVLYQEITDFEHVKKLSNNVLEFLKFDFEKLYCQLHLGVKTYQFDGCTEMYYVGSFSKGKIKIKHYLLLRGLFKNFYEEGYIKTKNTTAYTFSGKKIDLLRD